MNNLLLIADSGSTKTDWCVVRDGISARRITTKGMNPYLQTSEEMEVEMASGEPFTFTVQDVQHRSALSLPIVCSAVCP